MKREDWAEEGASSGPSVWYMGGRVIAGVYGHMENVRLGLTLSLFATVFQTEVKAIMKSAQASYELEKRICQCSICSDSRAALTYLLSPRIDSDVYRKVLGRLS